MDASVLCVAGIVLLQLQILMHHILLRMVSQNQVG